MQLFKRIFIIGNGFDRAHDYHTAYSDFRKWMEEKLIKEYMSLPMDDNKHLILDEDPEIPMVIMNQHGEEIPDEKQGMYLLMWLLLHNTSIGENWWNFEDALYDLDLEAVISANDLFVEDSAKDREGDVNPFYVDQIYEDMAGDLRASVNLINRLFAAWIEEVDISNVPMLPVSQLMDDDCLYLSFNYTETLEKIYRIPPYLIDHIHGLRYRAAKYIDDETAFPVTIGKIVVGHGNDHSRNFSPEYIAKEHILEDTIRGLRKPVDRILREHAQFWSWVFYSNAKDVYSYGFSYAEVDWPYIKQLLTSLLGGEDVTWYLHSFADKPDKDGIIWNPEYEKVIRGLGFKGKFDRFS